MASTDSGSSTRWRRVALAALVLAAAVILPGIANYALVQLGYETAGTAVWIVGYGTGVLVVWYVWIRPMDITGP